MRAATGNRFVLVRVWVFLFVVVFISCKKSPQAPETEQETRSTFTNPLLSSAPDPWVYQKDSTYYYLHTVGNKIQIWKTNKMSRLKDAVPVTVFTPPATGNNSRDIWAPELFFINNKWYIYYTASDGNDHQHRMWVLENSNADPTTGTWTDKGQLVTNPADLWSIDATVLAYENKLFLIWSGRPYLGGTQDLTQNLYISAMSDPFTITGPAVQVSSPQLDWEKQGFGVNEGPEILLSPEGKVLLVYSASFCGDDRYGLGLLKLTDGANPLAAASWIKSKTPAFAALPAANAYAVGHNGFFKSRDGKEDWIIYHANSGAGQGCGNTRNVRMQKFTWTADGLPNFGEPVSTGLAISVPSGE